MEQDAQKIINDYTGKRIDKLENRMDKFEERLDDIDDKIVVMDTKIDSQSVMLETLVGQQEDSANRRKNMFQSIFVKVIETVVIAVLGFIGTAVMIMLQGK